MFLTFLAKIHIFKSFFGLILHLMDHKTSNLSLVSIFQNKFLSRWILASWLYTDTETVWKSLNKPNFLKINNLYFGTAPRTCQMVQELAYHLNGSTLGLFFFFVYWLFDFCVESKTFILFSHAVQFPLPRHSPQMWLYLISSLLM